MDGKIKGCKEGGFAYRHEYRHKIQIEQWSLLYIAFIVLFLIRMLVGGYYIGKNSFDFYDFVLLLPTIIMAALELDAHIYAFRKRK